jgi:hypothetical protein
MDRVLGDQKEAMVGFIGRIETYLSASFVLLIPAAPPKNPIF